MFPPSPLPATEPPRDCPRCPRLVDLRETLRVEHQEWWNAPVPAFGDPQAWLAIVGLAPGRLGANRTGRPFTGDASGPLVYETLAVHGLATGTFVNDVGEGTQGDDLALTGAILINAVRCLPPANKPTPEEMRTCRDFLEAQLDAMPSVRVVVALGEVAHQSAVKAMGGRLPKCRFAHGAEHRVPDGRMLIDSYHPSRLNQNTGRLTPEMFDDVFARAMAVRHLAVPLAPRG